MIGTLIAKHVARKQLAARARNNVDAFLAPFAEDAVFVFPGEPPVGGTFHGLTEIRAWFERYRELFPQPHFELVNVFVSRLFALGNTNELAIQWRVRISISALIFISR